MADTPIRAVSLAELRRIFNDGRYYHKTQTGDLWEDVLESRHAVPYRSGQPPCTWSQIVAYRDNGGHKIAVVHQYVRTDKTLGASGKPDPKWLLVDGTIGFAPVSPF
jgi:hypothetical protein